MLQTPSGADYVAVLLLKDHDTNEKLCAKRFRLPSVPHKDGALLDIMVMIVGRVA